MIRYILSLPYRLLTALVIYPVLACVVFFIAVCAFIILFIRSFL